MSEELEYKTPGDVIEDGFYWVLDGDGSEAVVLIVDVCVMYSGTPSIFTVADLAFIAGPIQKPKRK